MGFFNFKKKKQERKYDPNNLKITDLQKGFMLDYELKTWEVKEVYEYDWGNNEFSFEYKLDSGDEQVYLSVDEDDGLELTITTKVKIRAIDEDLPEYIANHEKPPKKLIFNNINYFRDSQSAGYFRNMDTPPEQSAEFIAWDYYDKKEQLTISIEQWGEHDFEASQGKVVEEFEFSNILPV